MAGWGDDPVLKELIEAIGDDWKPVKLREDKETAGRAVRRRDRGEGRREQEFKSDHLHFHRYVEGLMEDHGL